HRFLRRSDGWGWRPAIAGRGCWEPPEEGGLPEVAGGRGRPSSGLGVRRGPGWCCAGVLSRREARRGDAETRGAASGVRGVAGGGGEEPAAVEDAGPAVEVPPFEVVKDEGRVTELLSEGVDADGARAVIDAWVAEHQDGWEGQHTVQVIAEPDAGMVVCRARWV